SSLLPPPSSPLFPYTTLFRSPPATVATNLASAAFAPTTLANGTTYYWQVTAKNAGGATAGPVTSFATIVAAPGTPTPTTPVNGRSEEHTSELQSRSDLVCRLL